MNFRHLFTNLDSWSEWKPLVYAFVIILVSLLVRKVFAKYLLTFLQKILDKKENKYLNAIFGALRKPTQGFIILIGFYFGLKQIDMSKELTELWSHVFRSLIIALIATMFYNLCSKSSVVFEKLTNRFDVNVDKIIIPFFSRILHALIISLSISVIAKEWGYDVNGFITGLGIGGVAVALAAKDALSHLLSGIIIITEKPFSIGDWIETPEGKGTVEDITFRSTKIRSFDQGIVTIPNGNLANKSITNWSKMGKRKLSFKIGFTEEIEKKQLQTVVSEIESMIKSHEGVHSETIHVKFNGIKDSCPEVLTYFFTNSTIWEEYLNVKQDINYNILHIIEKQNKKNDTLIKIKYIEEE